MAFKYKEHLTTSGEQEMANKAESWAKKQVL